MDERGVASDSTGARPGPPNEGQVRPGRPVAAKPAHAARMTAASCCWSASSVPGTGALGRPKRYCSSELCVATWGTMLGGTKRWGAASSLNS